MVVLCVCLNPAIDVTYRLDGAAVRGASHRVVSVSERAGGKGVNVARVLRQLGADVTLLCVAGGPDGELLRAELQDDGLDATFVDVGGSTRRTLVLVDPEQATVFNEPGPAVTLDEWLLIQERFAELLEAAELVVLSGSLPPDLPQDGYATLIGLARERGIPVILDADRLALVEALPAGPSIVKPNLAELESFSGTTLSQALGGSGSWQAAVAVAAQRLLDAGAGGVVVSLGQDGLIAVTPDGEWRAVSPQVLDGNPTGAGDALVAALALGMVNDLSWPDLLRDAVATSASAVTQPLAGQIDLAVRDRLLPQIVVEELSAEPAAAHISPTPPIPSSHDRAGS